MPASDSYIFWCAPSVNEEDDDVGFEDSMPGEEELTDTKTNEKGKGRESMYVSLVEEMVQTVLEGEDFLLSEEELSFFTAYKKLSYNARYLLARLLVRKTGKWYRYDQLKYVTELGVEGIIDSMKELCGTLHISSHPSLQNEPSQTQGDSLSGKSFRKQDSIHCSQASDSMDVEVMKVEVNETVYVKPNSTFNYYAEDETKASIPDLLSCLKVDELKSLARTLKLSSVLTTRKALIDGLLACASAQTTIGGYASPTNSKSRKIAKDSKTLKLKQTCLSFKPTSKPAIQLNILRDLVLNILKKCIRVNDTINALFHRMHIIYFRSTEHPTSLLTPALLRRCRKRYYPLYRYIRTTEIFSSREALIAYEEALRMEAAIDMMLEGTIDVEVAQEHIDAWAKGREGEYTALVPPPHTLTARDYSPGDLDLNDAGKENDLRWMSSYPRSRSASVSAKIEIEDEIARAPPKESQTVFNAKYVISVFERVYPRWKELVRERGEFEGRPQGLERFDEGYILTRLVYKGATAYGKLKNFKREIELLQELLSQRRWRRGKRGAWYDRWALVLMHHIVREKREIDGQLVPPTKEEQKDTLKEAMKVVLDGLHDEDTHIVSRQALEHRLTRLEKRLKIPMKDRHDCVGKLQKAVETKIVGERIRHRKNGVAHDKTGKVVNRAVIPVSVQIQGEDAVRKHLDQVKKDQRKVRWTGKSLWYGKMDEEVNVETLVLHHLELEGFRGFHSEGNILSTIWGLLFWDTLFSPVPGAFETPYQSAPLDIATECFYFSRREAIERRLHDIKEGKAPDIIAEVDDKYRENNTMCVGVRWNDFTKQELVEIVTCLGGEGLSVICRLFCEDYGGRHGGIPDLIVWRMEDKLAKFVEVKGPGDNLSETQKVWIDVLSRAGINVEVCRVVEKEKTKEPDQMSNAPKKHVVIRVYHIDEGKEGVPINVDEDSEAEIEEIDASGVIFQGGDDDENSGHRRKRMRTEGNAVLDIS